MASNKSVERFSPIQFTSPTTVKSGDALIIQGTSLGANRGSIAAVANEDYGGGTGGTTLVSADTEGAFLLPVTALSAESPNVSSAVAFGDALYANVNTGTYDATTGVFRGFTIDKNPSGVLFGFAYGTVTAGATATIAVMLKNSFHAS